MPKCSVSEKTLELNTCCSMIEDLRGRFPLAYVEGYTLKHEGLLGLDVAIKVPPSVQLLSLQFKKPLKCLSPRPFPDRYVYLVNNNKPRDQHLLLILLSLALKRLGRFPSVFYALPLVCNTTDLEWKVVRLLEHTVFVKVLDVPFVDFRPCKLEVDAYSRYVYFSCSSRRRVMSYTWEYISTRIEEMAVPIESLRRIAEIEYEELEEDLISHLREWVEPPVMDRVVEYVRSKHMEQLITAIALGRRRE
ncbi:MAG: hypothetical protein QXJ99_02435 [Thermofilum sp.]